MAKYENDLILTVGPLVLVLVLLQLLRGPIRRAYAVTVPCAAACAPFKNSPGTYATCCKQHEVVMQSWINIRLGKNDSIWALNSV
jgi:hypothetical protein